jgi:hypothetical protein
VVPALEIGEVRHAVPLAVALSDGGLTCVEITFRTAAAAEAIRAVATEAPDVLVGAGTVRTVGQADMPVAAGAQFLVAPGLAGCYIPYVCFPGAARVSASWPTVGTCHGEAWWPSADKLSIIRNKVGATNQTFSSHLNALVDSGLVADHIAEPPADRDWANERPGMAGAPVYLVVRALGPPSPSVYLP